MLSAYPRKRSTPSEPKLTPRSLVSRPHLPWLLNDWLSFQGVQLRDNVPAGLPPGKNSSTRPLRADPGPDLLRSPTLVLGKVRKIRAVALPGVKHVVPELATRVEHRFDGLDGRLREKTEVRKKIEPARWSSDPVENWW